MRFFRSKKLWIGVIAVVALFVFCGWLVSSYTPPFPPHWIGVKYFLFTADKPVSQEDIEKIPKDLNAIQSALVVLKPVTPEAKELLPPEMVVNTFTLKDKAAIDAVLKIALAQYLTGTDPKKRDMAQAILNDPKSAVTVDKLLVAITQSNNLSVSEKQINEKLGTVGKEVPAEQFDKVQEKIMLAQTLEPLSSDEAKKTATPLTSIKKMGVYRIYKDKESLSASPSATYRENFTDFVTVNNKLVPIRGGSSPLVILKPGSYALDEGAIASPVTFYLTLHTIEGLPYNSKSVGHGWVSLSRKEVEKIYPMMTMSLFNLIDEDNVQNVDRGEVSNIATYTNLGINNNNDWERASKILNYIPITNGPTRSRLAEITPEKARSILYMRAWYLPQYSTKEYYKKYLTQSLKESKSVKDSLALLLQIGKANMEEMAYKSFWGAVQMKMNGTTGDTSYNGVVSNCVAYSTAFWNMMTRREIYEEYDARMPKIVPVPGKLFHVMDPKEVIDLPDAETLPANQQNVPYPTPTGTKN